MRQALGRVCENAVGFDEDKIGRSIPERLLHAVAAQASVAVHAYVPMTNHIHLWKTATRENAAGIGEEAPRTAVCPAREPGT